MALTHTTATRNALADLIDDLANVSTPGDVQIGTTAFGTILATFVLSATAFGIAAGGVITANGLPLVEASADNTGTAAVFRVRDGAGLEVFQGDVTVTSGGGSMELTSLSITQNEQVNITAFTYEASA